MLLSVKNLCKRYDVGDFETTKKIKKLANTLAIIHKLDIQSNLNCQYKKINIDLRKKLT